METKVKDVTKNGSYCILIPRYQTLCKPFFMCPLSHTIFTATMQYRYLLFPDTPFFRRKKNKAGTFPMITTVFEQQSKVTT